ncbi:MAG TPA: lytic murein transglycosylase [Hyphomicrobiaceae bacterium]|nr:lytic murein transglycosylase [Hyphomicrobiaceae bacterium]
MTMRKFTALLTMLALALLGASSRVATADPSFQAFVASLWAEASRPPYNISRTTFDRATRGLTPDFSLPDLEVPGRPPSAAKQAEFVRPPQDYINARQLANLATQGRTLATKHADAIRRIEREIGVEGPILLAIWGRETAFGTYRLPHAALRVLATQAWVGRRKDMFRTEFLYALKMVEDGIATPETMRSSWAGAMGLTQFMPSEFYTSLRGLGGGRPDLFNSPPDALASAAWQLKQKGWVTGLPWGYEVDLGRTATCALEGPHQGRRISEWMKLGIVRADGRAFTPAEQTQEAYLMSPGGSYGPSFLVTENYKVIRRYNTSDLYATFVGNLADRISGGGDFRRPWANIVQLREEDVRSIQRRLLVRGLPIEKLDGKTGSNTRSVIGAYQVKSKLQVDCWPTAALLDHLVKTGVK